MGHTLRACGFSGGLESWRKYKKKNCHLAKCFDTTPIWLCAAAPIDGADRDGLVVCMKFHGLEAHLLGTPSSSFSLIHMVSSTMQVQVGMPYFMTVRTSVTL